MSKAQELSSVFDAAQSISFAAGEGIDFGGASLDDYEEGTWTPTYEGISSNPTVTYNSRTEGFFTKVGNIVHIACIIETDAFSGGSGDLLLANLPFAQDLTGDFQIGFATCQGNNFGSNDPALIVFSPDAAGANRAFLSTDFDNASPSRTNCSNAASGSRGNRIRFTWTYRTP